MPNPWLQIPIQDYEGHMDQIGQSAALRECFACAYSRIQPRRLLILGCTTGRDFRLVDRRVTENCVGVDVNPDYLAQARRDFSDAMPTIEFIESDVIQARLPSQAFDQVHAALVFEYVNPVALFKRIAEWLAPGGVCSTVTQNPSPQAAKISKTAFTSLNVLSGKMELHTPEEMEAAARAAGFQRSSCNNIALPHLKSFSAAMFDRP